MLWPRIGFCFLSIGILAAETSAEIPARAIGALGIGGLRDAFNAHDYLSEKPIQLVSPEAYQYSTLELAEMIGKLGDHMFTQFGRKTIVGDLSHKLGGRMARDSSHRNGLDVDIGYFGKVEVKNGHRSERHHNRFPESFLTKKGKLSENFDLRLNFEAFKYLVDNFDIRFILVTCEVKRAVKFAEAYSQQDRDKILSKMWAKRAHDDHFHVRLSCPPGHDRCDGKMPERVFSDRNCSL